MTSAKMTDAEMMDVVARNAVGFWSDAVFAHGEDACDPTLVLLDTPTSSPRFIDLSKFDSAAAVVASTTEHDVKWALAILGMIDIGYAAKAPSGALLPLGGDLVFAVAARGPNGFDAMFVRAFDGERFATEINKYEGLAGMDQMFFDDGSTDAAEA